MKALRRACGVLMLLGLPACATSFQGSAHISPAACEERCRSIGQRVAAYVFVGEYSTACVCEPQDAPQASSRDMGSVVAAAAGVWMQTQARQQQQQ